MELLEDGLDRQLLTWKVARMTVPNHEIFEVGLRDAAALRRLEIVHENATRVSKIRVNGEACAEGMDVRGRDARKEEGG